MSAVTFEDLASGACLVLNIGVGSTGAPGARAPPSILFPVCAL